MTPIEDPTVSLTRGQATAGAIATAIGIVSIIGLLAYRFIE